jgi:transcription antitermination factor NusG
MPDIQTDNIVTMSGLFVNLRETGRMNNSRTTVQALNSLSKSLGGAEIAIADLNQETLRTWIDDVLTTHTTSTLVRYIETLSKIYALGLRLGVIENKGNIFADAKEYVFAMTDEGFDKESQSQIKTLQLMANATLDPDSFKSKAVDVYLYSFYHVGLDIEAVIDMQLGDGSVCSMPQTDKFIQKYQAVNRKYIFPLKQWQRTKLQIMQKLEEALVNYLRDNDIKLGKKSPKEYISTAWVAAAKSCGVPNEDICACCPSVINNPRLKGVNPSQLTQQQIDDIKRKVANVILDMATHWYAIRFVGKDDLVRRNLNDICSTTQYNLYYPVEEIYKKAKKKLVVESRPTIRNVMFIQTTASTINKIETAKVELRTFHVIRNKARKNRNFAIIPNHEMRTFSVLVSNGMDILGEEEVQELDIVEGCYVEITEGLNKGYRGKVFKIRDQGKTTGTMLQIEACLCPNLSEIMNKMYIMVNPQFVKCLKELPTPAK